MKTNFFTLAAVAALSALIHMPAARAQSEAAEVPPPAGAAEEAPAEGPTGPPQIEGVEWQTEGKGELGTHAVIDIPEGFVFTGSQGTQKLMEAMQNPVSGRELGFLAPPDIGWFLVFEFDPSGYVKDDEKADLDADAILKSIQEAQKRGNEARRAKGWSELQVLGWFSPPKYNEATHNLEWATRNMSEGHEGINYNTRLLGRQGVMEVTLVAGPEQMQEVLPVYQQLLGGYAYKEGNRYAEYKQGDKIATYGLAALAAGGATVLAAKTGLLAKFWKVLVLGGAALLAGIKKLWDRVRRVGVS